MKEQDIRQLRTRARALENTLNEIVELHELADDSDITVGDAKFEDLQTDLQERLAQTMHELDEIIATSDELELARPVDGGEGTEKIALPADPPGRSGDKGLPTLPSTSSGGN